MVLADPRDRMEGWAAPEETLSSALPTGLASALPTPKRRERKERDQLDGDTQERHGGLHLPGAAGFTRREWQTPGNVQGFQSRGT